LIEHSMSLFNVRNNTTLWKLFIHLSSTTCFGH